MGSLEDLEDLAGSQICLRCLGRALSRIWHGYSNLDRGRMISFVLEGLGKQVKYSSEDDCSICHGLFTKLPALAEIVKNELDGFEFDRFLIGSELSDELRAVDTRVMDTFESAESIKKEFNREFGKILSDALEKEVDLKDPDVIVTVDLGYFSLRYWIKSLYVRGRYRKLVRGIPQTRWIHDRGTQSVEEVIGTALLELSDGKNFYLHGAGREDVDVRMLGNGREFIIEVSDPKKRKVDLEYLHSKINKSGSVEVSDLMISNKSEVERVKATHFDKMYRAVIRSADVIPRIVLEKAVSELPGKIIYQRTPLRVSRRRADTVREKKIIEAAVVEVDENLATVDIKAQAGTYIKELISGDGGRTSPSLSSLCGFPLSVEELDVTGICMEESSNDEDVTRA